MNNIKRLHRQSLFAFAGNPVPLKDWRKVSKLEVFEGKYAGVDENGFIMIWEKVLKVAPKNGQTKAMMMI